MRNAKLRKDNTHKWMRNCRAKLGKLRNAKCKTAMWTNSRLKMWKI